MEERFDAVTIATANLVGLLESEQAEAYDEHLLVWADYVGWMKDNAYDLLFVLEAADEPV